MASPPTALEEKMNDFAERFFDDMRLAKGSIVEQFFWVTVEDMTIEDRKEIENGEWENWRIVDGEVHHYELPDDIALSLPPSKFRTLRGGIWFCITQLSRNSLILPDAIDDLQHAFAEFLNGILGCRSLIRLDKEVRRKGEESSFETRYFISCLDPNEVSAKEFQELILGHWEVENCLHGQKDRFYGEDKYVVGRDSWGKAWTVLTNIALSLAQLFKKRERTLKEVREWCGAKPMMAAKKTGLK